MTTPASWFLLAFSLCVAVVAHLIPSGTYSSPEMMNAYFGGEAPPGSWKWDSIHSSWTTVFEPFKYRLVFRGAVDSLANLSLFAGASRDLHTYWLAFLTVSVAAHMFAIFCCYLFLQALELTHRVCLTGIIAWLLLPPILLAYSYPVQTKEDFIAYGLCFLALRAMLREDWGTVVFICIFGAFVRETLLFVSGIFLIGTYAPRSMKIAALLLPIGIHIMLRVIMGMDGYDVYRETNFISYLLPPAAFMLAFGYGWLAIAIYLTRANLSAALLRSLDLFKTTTPPPQTQEQRLKTLRDALPYALLLMMVAQLFMGRVQEIRILCLLSPFVLLALYDMFKSHVLTKQVIIRALVTAATVAALLVAFEVLGAGTVLRDLLNPYLAEFAQTKWWATVYLQVILATGVYAAYRYRHTAHNKAG